MIDQETIKYLAIAGGAVFLIWPMVRQALEKLPSMMPKRASSSDFDNALKALAVVRSRIAASKVIDGEVDDAIQVITIALIEGSDK